MIKKAIWIVVVAIVIAAGIWFWATHRFSSSGVQQAVNSTSTNATTTSLGSQIYAKEANPLNSVSASATSPSVPNPVQGIYKNPFQ